MKKSMFFRVYVSLDYIKALEDDSAYESMGDYHTLVIPAESGVRSEPDPTEWVFVTTIVETVDLPSVRTAGLTLAEALEEKANTVVADAHVEATKYRDKAMTLRGLEYMPTEEADV